MAEETPGTEPQTGEAPRNFELVLDVPLEVTVQLGRTRMPIRQLLQLAAGSIVELEKAAGERLEVLINGKPIARGEVVVIDEEFGLRITEVASGARGAEPPAQ